MRSRLTTGSPGGHRLLGSCGLVAAEAQPHRAHRLGVGAIRTVARGKTHLKPGLTDRILKSLQSLPRDFPALEPPDPLTGREVEIVRLMAVGAL